MKRGTTINSLSVGIVVGSCLVKPERGWGDALIVDGSVNMDFFSHYDIVHSRRCSSVSTRFVPQRAGGAYDSPRQQHVSTIHPLDLTHGKTILYTY
jgi:hypothetical protein